MVAWTAGPTPRSPLGQQVALVRVRLREVRNHPITGAAEANNATHRLAMLPNGANILRISTLVRTAFSQGSPVVSFGTIVKDPNPASIPPGEEIALAAVFFAATAAPLTTAGRNNLTLIGGTALGLTANTIITATVSGISGTPASMLGVADAEIEYTIAEGRDTSGNPA